jgi:hypothetical protein
MAAIGIINGIDKIHEELFNDGGVRILIGDGMLPKYGLEKILESYYSYAITPSLKLSVDYRLAARFRSSASGLTAPVSRRRHSMRWRQACLRHCPSGT